MPSRRLATRIRPDPVRDVFFRHMVTNMRSGVLAIARSGEVVLINEEARRIFNLPDAGYAGRPYVEVLRSHPDVLRILGGVFEISALPNRAEIRLKSTETVIGYTLSLVRNDDGVAVGAALFFKDLTYVEQMEERERLRDRLAAVGEMAANVAHEIKNRLAGVEVNAGWLRRQVPDRSDLQSIVADIINEAKEANAIVQKVLEFVRPVRLQLDRTSLADALHAAIAVADGKARRGEIAVDVSAPASLPCIEGDRHQLTQLFANLLINAYEALDGRGAITLSARLAESETAGALLADGASAVPSVVVEVSDTGPGVSAEVAEKLFRPFITTKPQGSGLGLAIVRKIVDAHDGLIDVRSVPNAGTTFRVTLPVAHAQGWVGK